MARGFSTGGPAGGTQVSGSLSVIEGVWQTDFSGQPTWLYVEDNNGRLFLINHETQTRIPVGGPGEQRALAALFGDPIQGVFLTGYNETDHSAIDLFGGPNEIERVVAGRAVNPLTGELIDNPQSIQAGNGDWYHPPTDEDGDVPDASEPPEEPEDQGPSQDVLESLKAELDWMPEPVLQEFIDNYIETGNETRALHQTRRSDVYAEHFPGNLREGGGVHRRERDYMADMEFYRRTIADFGVEPEAFEHKFPELIQGGVSGKEFEQRMYRRWNKMAQVGDNVREYFANEFGTGDVSNQAILASLMDPDINPVEFDQQFRTSVVGGMADRFGFDVALSEAEQMSDFIGSQQASQQFFSRAQGFLPTLGALVSRHEDPNDDFELDELFDALVIGDNQHRSRIERLLAQESSTFTPVRPRDLSPR